MFYLLPKFYSYYLYNISHPNPHGNPVIDLKDDPEAAVTVSQELKLSQNQLLIERIINKVFNHYKIPLDVTDSIRATFKTKFWRMGKRLSTLGGPRRSQEINKWKDTIWTLTVTQDEVCKQLRKRKCEVENLLSEEISKRRKLEQDLQSLEKEVTDKQTSSQPQRSQRKQLQAYSRQQRSNIRKKISSKIKLALSDCTNEHYKPIYVDLQTSDGERETLNLKTLSFSKCATTTSTNEDITKFALFIKDKFCLSDHAYHELSLVSGSLPKLHIIKKERKSINCMANASISPTTGVVGVQQTLRSRLNLHINEFQRSGVLENFLSDGCIRIKLAGDGTRVGRGLNLINFTFTFVDKEAAKSVAGNHTLAILKCEEKYFDLAAGLSSIAEEVKTLSHIAVNGEEYKIEYFLSGDWKFLAVITGLNAANADYSCIWCKCKSAERWNMEKEWSITEIENGARTIDEIDSLRSKPSKLNFGCLQKPIFLSISIDYIIIDTLHLFLRIADLLINLLIMELRRQDGIDKKKSFKLDRTKLTHLATYETFLNEECKIPFRWYSEEEKHLKWRDLTGTEKHRLFSKIDISTLLPSIPKCVQIQQLWMTFYTLVKMLSADKVDPMLFKQQARKWVDDFCGIYQTKNVTPYVHALAMHVHEFIQLYGNISRFSAQGLEKLNDLTTLHYMRSTNHKEIEALSQIIEKRNRLEYLECTGHQQEKRKYHCSCSETGHNKLKCYQSKD